jgi:hypothetical protein
MGERERAQRGWLIVSTRVVGIAEPSWCDREEMRGLGEILQCVKAAVGESDSRSGHQVLDRARDEHFTRSGEGARQRHHTPTRLLGSAGRKQGRPGRHAIQDRPRLPHGKVDLAIGQGEAIPAPMVRIVTTWHPITD